MSAWARVGAAIVLLGGALGMLRLYDRSMDKIEYLSVPAAVTTHALAAGFENMAADGLYLQFVHYFGKHLRSRQKYYNIQPVLELITDLDPHFVGAYVYGGMALGDNGQVDASEALWAKGVRLNPGSYDFAYQAGMNLFLFGERPDQYLRAAELFKLAGTLPGAKPEAAYMEARMYQVTDRKAMAIAIWKDTYLHSPSEEARGVAKRSLERLGVPLPVRP
jgi:hypothetical protein